MKETFGLWSLLTVGSSIWISITAGGFECNLNQFLSRCSYAKQLLLVLLDRTKSAMIHVVLRHE